MGVGDPASSLQPLALRVGEYPENRVRALMRVVSMLRQSNSLDLFTEIQKVKAKLEAGEEADLHHFFDMRREGLIDFEEFQQMLSFYGIKLPFEKTISIFMKASKGKGLVEKENFDILMDSIADIVITRTLQSMGFTTINIIIGIVSLTVVLSAVLVFIVLGIQGFTDNSDLGAVTASLLPAGAGKGAQKEEDTDKIVKQSSTAASGAFQSILGSG